MAGEGMEKALRYRWLIFLLLGLGYILVYFHRLCPAVVAEDMRLDLDAGGGLLGLLGSAYFYPYALMQLPAGLLSDSWGPRRTITVFFLVAFAGSMIMGMTHSIFWAILGRTLVGLGVSMLFVPTMKILAEWCQVKEFAGMTGLLIAMGGTGSIIATTPLAWLSDAVGWRSSFVIVGAATLLLAALVWLFVRDRPSDFGWASPAGVARADAPAIGLWEGVKKVLACPAFWPLAAWFFFGCAIFFTFVGLWGGPFLMQIYGLSKAEAGKVLSLAAIGMIAGSPLLGAVSNRLFKGRKPVLVIAGFITVLVTAVLAFYTDRIPVAGLYALCFLMGVFTNAIVVIGFTAAKELFPVRMAGTSTGLVNLFPFLGGALCMPLAGNLLERSGKTANGHFLVAGYHHAFLALFICGVLSFLASLFIRETMAREETD